MMCWHLFSVMLWWNIIHGSKCKLKFMIFKKGRRILRSHKGFHYKSTKLNNKRNLNSSFKNYIDMNVGFFNIQHTSFRFWFMLRMNCIYFQVHFCKSLIDPSQNCKMYKIFINFFLLQCNTTGKYKKGGNSIWETEWMSENDKYHE